MNKIELAQRIGSEVCEDCFLCRDCGIEPIECGRIDSAIKLIDTFLGSYTSQPTVEADAFCRCKTGATVYNLSDNFCRKCRCKIRTA